MMKSERERFHLLKLRLHTPIPSWVLRDEVPSIPARIDQMSFGFPIQLTLSSYGLGHTLGDITAPTCSKADGNVLARDLLHHLNDIKD